MTEEPFQYDQMVEEALRSVVRRSLRQAASHGLPGNHHFYITFKTHGPGVTVPSYLAEKYPDEMTIVMQYQFWDLEVREDGFDVTLSFNDVRERLVIPFDCVSGFADPSVKFGLQFQTVVDDVEAPEPVQDLLGEEEPADPLPDEESGAGNDETGPSGAQVVSLDHFRKKK